MAPACRPFGRTGLIGLSGEISPAATITVINLVGRRVASVPLSEYTLRFDADAVVHRSANSLLAAEITLRRLDGDMT